jgi:HEAT repeat protein
MDLRQRLKQVAASDIEEADLGFLTDLTLQEVEEFIQAFSSLGEEQRWRIVRRMADLAMRRIDEDYERVLIASLQDPSPKVRQAAVHGLEDDMSPGRARALISALKRESDPQVRMALVEALSEVTLADARGELPEGWTDEVCSQLERILLDEKELMPLRRAALLALSYYSDNQVARAVIDSFYTSEDPSDRAAAIAAMGRTVDPGYLPAIMEGLRSRDPEIRFEAAVASGELEAEETVPELIRLLGDKHAEIALAAVDALGSIGTKECVHVLRELAEGDNLDLATAAEEALAYALWKLYEGV